MSFDFTGIDNRPPLLIVLSGPSGVGKDATVNRMRQLKLPIHVVVTATTRPKRPNETQGIDYHFVSKDEFQHMINDSQLLEWARVYDNYYGIPKSEIKGALEIGTNVIIKADVQGSATIKKIAPDAILIFLIPPSLEELSERLLRRHGQYSSDLELRLKTAEEEMQQLDIFDYVISSTKDNIDLIVSKIQAIITTEKCRVNPRIVNL